MEISKREKLLRLDMANIKWKINDNATKYIQTSKTIGVQLSEAEGVNVYFEWVAKLTRSED